MEWVRGVSPRTLVVYWTMDSFCSEIERQTHEELINCLNADCTSLFLCPHREGTVLAT